MSASFETILVEKEDGITWVKFNRPDKRNAMSPQLHYDMKKVGRSAARRRHLRLKHSAAAMTPKREKTKLKLLAGKM